MFRNVSKSNTSPSTSSSNYPRINSRLRGRGRGGGGGFNNRHQGEQDAAKRGLFVDGIWLCNCAPRLPAEHFKVKKEGRNKGRWFYTCQNSEGRRCGFFLWDEDAKPREEAAVLSGKRNEPRATPGVFENVQPAVLENVQHAQRDSIVQETQFPGKGPSQMTTQSQEPPPPYSPFASSSSTTLGRSAGSEHDNRIGSMSNSKRTVADAGFDEVYDDDDESFPWDLTGKEADELEARASLAPETPRKAVKIDTYATPATSAKRQLPWLNHAEFASKTNNPETPSKTIGGASLPTPSITKETNNLDNDVTPTHSRFRDALAQTGPSSTLAEEVFDILKSASVSVSSDLSSKLRAALNRHDLKTQGVVKGREMVRLALKARDAKVVELDARIAALEAEREVDRARIRGLRLKDSKIV